MIEIRCLDCELPFSRCTCDMCEHCDYNCRYCTYREGESCYCTGCVPAVFVHPTQEETPGCSHDQPTLT